MTTLRTVVLILIGLLTNAVALSDAIDPQAASLTTPLGLSQKQTQELSKVFKASRDKIQTIRKELKAVNAQKQAQIDTVLTQEQKKKYAAMQTPSYPKESEPQPPQMMPMGIDAELTKPK